MLRDTKFLLSIDKEERELYILHREFPRCLIYVEQTVPVNFVVFDLFEDNLSEEDAIKELTKPEFKAQLNDFWQSQAFSAEDLN